MPRHSRVLQAVAVGLILAGCGSAAAPRPAASQQAAAGAKHHGTVSVLYAGSLQAFLDTRLGPAFTRATGYSIDGYPAGSKDLANEIKARVRVGDVFISASPKVNARLAGKANGDWLSWYAPFATTALVLGYNPSSGFAKALRTAPWYRVIRRAGFRVGFTDPTLDPKGELTVAALDDAAARNHLPQLRRVGAQQSDVFPEQDLVGRLQAGQLDAGFFYTVEASAAKIPTVSLAPIVERATYTIGVLNRGPDPAGASAFVRFLLGSRGRALLRSAGLTLLVPRAVGTGVPASLRPPL